MGDESWTDVMDIRLVDGEEELVGAHPGAVAVKVTWLRWVQLVLFSCLSLLSAYAWMTFPPVANLLGVHFSASAVAVDSLTWVWLVVAAFLGPLSAAITHRHGLRVALLLAATLTAAGACIRAVSISSFWGLWVGSLVMSLGNPFIQGLPPVLAMRWFPTRERAAATSVAFLANAMGVGMAFATVPVVVRTINDLTALLWMEAVVACGMAVLLVVVARAAPSAPPSEAEAKLPVFRGGFVSAAVRLLRMPSFVVLLAAFAVVAGSLFGIVGVVLLPILAGVGIEEEEGGQMGASNVAAGMLAVMAVGPLVGRYHCYKAGLVTAGVTAAVSFAALAVAVYTGAPRPSSALLFAAFALEGVAANAMVPIGLEAAVEFTYPAPEAISSNLLMQAANGMACVLAVLVGETRSGVVDAEEHGTPLPVASASDQVATALGAVALLNLLAGLACLCLPATYRRLGAERVAVPAPVEGGSGDSDGSSVP